MTACEKRCRRTTGACQGEMGKKGAMSAFVLLVGIAVGGAAEAQVTGQAHEYVVPNHGKLTLAFPGNLKGFSKPVSEPASVLLRFRPQTGDAFYVQVTSVWLDATKIATSTPEHLKATVAASEVRQVSAWGTRPTGALKRTAHYT